MNIFLKATGLALAFVAVMLAITGVGAYFWYLQAVKPVGTEQAITITIDRGTSTRRITELLESQGVIKSAMAYRIFLRANNQENTLQAGTFTLSPSMTANEITKELQIAESESITIKVLEGWRLEEVAENVAADFTELELPFDEKVFLEIISQPGVYLFPDTYDFSLTATEQDVADKLVTTFEQRVVEGLASDIRASGRSLHEVMTLAALLEREARQFKSKQEVAGILWRRVDEGWPLDLDATLQYIQGKTGNNWWPDPNVSFKSSDNPYNTYKFPGLPPGPISLVGLDTIKAAVTPIESPYYFYITGNDNKMHYAVTLQEHNENIQSYLR